MPESEKEKQSFRNTGAVIGAIGGFYYISQRGGEFADSLGGGLLGAVAGSFAGHLLWWSFYVLLVAIVLFFAIAEAVIIAKIRQEIVKGVTGFYLPGDVKPQESLKKVVFVRQTDLQASIVTESVQVKKTTLGSNVRNT